MTNIYSFHLAQYSHNPFVSTQTIFDRFIAIAKSVSPTPGFLPNIGDLIIIRAFVIITDTHIAEMFKLIKTTRDITNEVIHVSTDVKSQQFKSFFVLACGHIADTAAFWCETERGMLYVIAQDPFKVITKRS